MIVGINYNTDGIRYIARLDYKPNRDNAVKTKTANMMKSEFDEVYIVDVNNADTAFINEIVLNGCRI